MIDQNLINHNSISLAIALKNGSVTVSATSESLIEEVPAKGSHRYFF